MLPRLIPCVIARYDTAARGPSGTRCASVSLMRFLRALYNSVLDDQIDNAGAMMAYYAVLSIFPMLLFVVTLGLLVLPGSTIDQGVRFAFEAAPSSIGLLVVAQVDNLTKHAQAGFAIGTFVFAWWGASRGASSLMQVLNRIYKKTETRHWLKRQGIAIAVTTALAMLLVLALGLLVAGPRLGHLIEAHVDIPYDLGTLWTVIQWAGAGVMVMVIWALAYKFLPDTDAPFRIFTPGAFVGVALWLGISRLFGLYLDNFASYDSTYGTLGGGVVLLTWLWLSNIALLFGAEINQVLAQLRKHRSAAARVLADPAEHLHAVAQ